MKSIVVFMLVFFCCTTHAEETAQLVRSTDLKSQPFSDASTVTTLSESSKVEVISRKASWVEVKAGNDSGWVKLLSLRFGGTPQSGKSDSGSGLKSLYNLATTGSSGSVVTTSARGFDKSKFTNPSPNTQALKTMQAYAASKQEAEKFAAAGNLQTQQVAYIESSKRK